jgi:hypothetical protein
MTTNPALQLEELLQPNNENNKKSKYAQKYIGIREEQ